MTLHEELIQVAAVAVAWITNLETGTDDMLALAEKGFFEDRTWVEIMDERHRQNQKWGVRDQESGTWLKILMEEVGEVATATLEEGQR